jgi:hypothetical protein
MGGGRDVDTAHKDGEQLTSGLNPSFFLRKVRVGNGRLKHRFFAKNATLCR